MKILPHLLTIAMIPMAAIALAQEASSEPNNGTDPTKPPKLLQVSYSFTELRQGFRNDTIKLTYQTPIAPDGRTVGVVKVPLVSTDVLGRSGYGLGDIEVGVNKVMKVTAKHGTVLQANMIFNTADRMERGTGKTVLKVTGIYAFFLPGGDIFAPSLVQNNSIWGDGDRAAVNLTTADFYYVPKLKNPKLFLTLDPNINYNWEAEDFFAGLAVTLGCSLGPAMGGTSQVYVKPQIFFGSERPSNWGIEIGYKVLGF
jgi:hypothetical protein